MTKKDYKMISGIFKRTPTINVMMRLDKSEDLYFELLRLTIQALKKDNPNFDADKFMQEVG